MKIRYSNHVDASTVAHDCVELDHGDKEIIAAIKRLRYLHKQKGLVYYTLGRSKKTRTIRYLVAELNDKKGTILITNLDTQETYTFNNPNSENYEQTNSVNAGNGL